MAVPGVLNPGSSWDVEVDSSQAGLQGILVPTCCTWKPEPGTPVTKDRFRTSPNPPGMKLTAGKKELYPSMAPTAHLEKGSLPQGWVLGYLHAPFVKKATADPPGMAEG